MTATRPLPRPARSPRGPASGARPRRRAARSTVGALLALAVVATAAAPGVITIRPGDTLWDLARAHGTSVSALQQLNGLSGNSIYAGQTLRVPGSSGGSSTGAATSGTHVVRRGDTLSHLAVRYGTTSAALRQANGLRSSTIRIGQELLVPGGAAAAPRSSSKGGSSSLSSSVAQNRATLAARDLPSKATVRRMVADTARRHGVPVPLALSVAYHESGFQQRVVSGVNAIGVMQVLPSTGSSLGRQLGRSFDLLDTQDNVTAGVLVLRQLLRGVGSVDRALAGYYQGLGSIAKKGVLPQTHAYIRSIHALEGRFANG